MVFLKRVLKSNQIQSREHWCPLLWKSQSQMSFLFDQFADRHNIRKAPLGLVKVELERMEIQMKLIW